MKFKLKNILLYVSLPILIILLADIIIHYKSIDDKVKEGGPENYNPRRGFYIENTLTPEISSDGSIGFTESVSEIMGREKNSIYRKEDRNLEGIKHIRPDRTKLPQNPESKEQELQGIDAPTYNTPQTIGISFHATELDPVNWMFPADNMGAVGTSQVIVAVNNRFKSFNKTTGLADGVLDINPDNFFFSVRGSYSTCDFRIRYDRTISKWFIIGINLPTVNNRIMFAVSDGPIITSSSNFTFFYINISGNVFFDYPTLGIDAYALYIGGNLFNRRGSFTRTDGYVIKKSSLTGSGPIQYTLFQSLATASQEGPYTPQGVDNFDASSPYGYFIGVDISTYGKLMIRRVSNPGGTPAISQNISLTVFSTSAAFTVPHFGNTNGTNGYLSAVDDRLYAAVIRGGNLWTAHNINVDALGTPNSSARNREAVRWYQIRDLNSTPSVVQSGTIYDNATSNPKNYWFPSFMVSGQGHVASVFSVAGVNDYINIGISGRLASDESNSMGIPIYATNNTTLAYNPPSNPGGTYGRRWGDYSYVSIDPDDDMTMWAFHGYCSATNIWGVRAIQLKAPPPAMPISAEPLTLIIGVPSTIVTVSGTSINGSGFFDPGLGFSKHITVSVTGGVTVNSVAYNNPTKITLDLNTMGATTRADIDLTVTNPDGQSITASGFFETALPVSLASFTSSVVSRNVKLNWTTSSEENNEGFEVQKAEYRNNETEIWNKIGFVKGKGNSNEPVSYSFEEKNLQTGKYKYRLKQIDYNGNFEYFELNNTVEIGVPAKFDLSQNYPNPFNPVTKINFDIPESGLVKIKVYDVLGKEVAMIINEIKDAGYHTVSFDASKLSSGLYFYRLSSKGFSSVLKMVVLK